MIEPTEPGFVKKQGFGVGPRPAPPSPFLVAGVLFLFLFPFMAVKGGTVYTKKALVNQSQFDYDPNRKSLDQSR